MMLIAAARVFCNSLVYMYTDCLGMQFVCVDITASDDIDCRCSVYKRNEKKQIRLIHVLLMHRTACVVLKCLV